jgi:hypothetical protein
VARRYRPRDSYAVFRTVTTRSLDLPLRIARRVANMVRMRTQDVTSSSSGSVGRPRGPGREGGSNREAEALDDTEARELEAADACRGQIKRPAIGGPGEWLAY